MKKAGFPQKGGITKSIDTLGDIISSGSAIKNILKGAGFDIDFVEGVPSSTNLPPAGTKGKLYVTEDIGTMYYDTGTSYLQIGGVAVKKDGTTIGIRRAINLIEGTGISIAVIDDSTNEEVDITITNTGSSTQLGSIPPVQVYGSSYYYCPWATNATAATTLALTASRTYWLPVNVRKTITSLTLAVNVTTASAGTHYLGIYSSNASDQPNALIANGSFSAGTTGVKTVALTSLNLTPGVYWIAWATGSAATVRAIAVAGAISFGLTSTMGTAHVTYWYTSGNTLPSNAPTTGYTGGTTALPAICIANWA